MLLLFFNKIPLVRESRYCEGYTAFDGRVQTKKKTDWPIHAHNAGEAALVIQGFKLLG